MLQLTTHRTPIPRHAANIFRTGEGPSQCWCWTRNRPWADGLEGCWKATRRRDNLCDRCRRNPVWSVQYQLVEVVLLIYQNSSDLVCEREEARQSLPLSVGSAWLLYFHRFDDLRIRSMGRIQMRDPIGLRPQDGKTRGLHGRSPRNYRTG